MFETRLEFVEHTRKLLVGTKTIGASKYNEYLPVSFLPDADNRFKISAPYNKQLVEEIKNMSHAKWHGIGGGPKLWSVKNDARTAFCVSYLDKEQPNPYEWYNTPIIQAPIWRKNLYAAQMDMINFGWTKHYCEWACEMGLGKSLSAIHLIELAYEMTTNPGDVWWVGPKSALAAVKYEFEIWDCPIKIDCMTYEGMTRITKQWVPGMRAPQIVIFDESSKVKNLSAQRTEAALHLANSVREEWGINGFVICMTGTPAPKAPIDWYSQVEICCPGFLKEGTPRRFRDRLAIVQKRDFDNGYSADQVLAWLDDDRKCADCGKYKDDICHGFDHKFRPSVNEVEKLRKRLMPVAIVRLKKDCLDLPDQRFQVLKFPMTAETKRYRDMLKKRANSVVHGLALCRELSDGFIYEQVKTDRNKMCPVCKGTKQELIHYKTDTGEQVQDIVVCPICAALDGDCPVCHGEGFIANAPTIQFEGKYEEEYKDCHHCKGSGEVAVMVSEAKEIGTPKDDAFRQLLSMHEESGRFVMYGGFTGTIDRIVRIGLKEGWDVIRCDGRGFVGMRHDALKWSYGDLVPAFQRKDSPVNKLLFAGHPEAGGMGLNLTRSHGVGFFSNSFKSDARSQSLARIHRIGMDNNLGATAFDLIYLPEDEVVLKVLSANRDLEKMTMVEFKRELETIKEAVSTPWIIKNL